MASPLLSEFSNRELLEQIASQVGAVYSGSTGVRHTADYPREIDIDQTGRYAVTLTDANGAALDAADIVVGTYNIKRTRATTTTTIVSGGTPSKADGIVYFDYTAADADWNVDDLLWVEFVGIQDSASGLTFPTIHEFSIVTNLATYQSTITNTYNIVNNGTYGNVAIETAIQAVITQLTTVEGKVDTAITDIGTVDGKVDVVDTNVDTLLTDVAAVDAVVDAIKAKTDNLPASPASTGDCITASGVRTAVGLASANLDTQLSAINSLVVNNATLIDYVEGVSAAGRTANYSTGFESGITGWTASSGSVAQSSAQARTGTYSMLLTYSGGAKVTSPTITRTLGVALVTAWCRASSDCTVIIGYSTFNEMRYQLRGGSWHPITFLLTKVNETSFFIESSASVWIDDVTVYPISDVNLYNLLLTAGDAALLRTPINAQNTPVTGSLIDIMNKDTSYTFSKTTDSLEAIADAIAAISTGSLAVTEAKKSNNMASTNPVTMSKDVGSGKLMEIMDIKFIDLVQSSDEEYTITIDLEDDRNVASNGTLGTYSVGAAASSATNKVNANLSLNSGLSGATGFPALRFPLYSRTIDITVNQIGGTEGTIIILLYYRTINSYTSENL